MNKPEIYVLRDAANKALKIGYSIHVQTRVAQHSTSHPFLALVAIFPATEQRTERQLHRYLDWYRIAGTTEWYSDSSQVRDRVNDFFIKTGLIDQPLNF